MHELGREGGHRPIQGEKDRATCRTASRAAGTVSLSSDNYLSPSCCRIRKCYRPTRPLTQSFQGLVERQSGRSSLHRL